VPMFYLPYGPATSMTLQVRSAEAGVASFQSLVRETVAGVDPDTPIARVRPMAAAVSAILAPQRVASILIGGLGAIGLALAALGIYGVLTFDVARRTREIGVRIALGAGAEGVARRVLERAARMVVLGVAIGVLAAVVVARTLEALLLGVSPLDPLALGAVLALLFAVAMLASYLPARRGGGVDPMIALRAE
jgi:ABC-type antimicrobial peptide transport system permease subunit